MIRTATLAVAALALTMTACRAHAGVFDDVRREVRAVEALSADARDALAADGKWDCEDFAYLALRVLEAQGYGGAQVWRARVGAANTAHALVRLPDGNAIERGRVVSEKDLIEFSGYCFVRPMLSITDQGIAPKGAKEGSPDYWNAVFADAECKPAVTL